MDAKQKHWETIYSTKAVDSVSWYREHLESSIRLIDSAGLGPDAEIIDVGGGASTLVDDLLDRGYENLTVLDLSRAALATAKSRLGRRATQIKWVEADILEADLPAQCYDVWHDRAVFHFLTTIEARSAYVEKVFKAVKPGGLVIVATFAEDGPTKCSGLPVLRYNSQELHAEFGAAFQFLGQEKESHLTPGGAE